MQGVKLNKRVNLGAFHVGEKRTAHLIFYPPTNKDYAGGKQGAKYCELHNN